MRRIAIAACLLTIASQVHAQTQPPIALPEWLDRLAAQWNAEKKGPRAPLRKPPGPSDGVIIPNHGLWKCLGADPWKPVLVSPNPKSEAMGQTSSVMAASGATVGEYAQVLYGRGHTAYVLTRYMHDYRSSINPHQVCAVLGTRPDGSPVFAYAIR
jgi:hypothetical protein